MTHVPTQIADNPLRILGVFGNATLKERAANLSRAKAFLRAGKSLTFPCDCAGALPPIVRTPETLARAESDLTFRENRLRSGQFWFVNKSPVDERALCRVRDGNLVGAANLWKQHTCVASWQNRLVCALIRNDWRQVLLVAAKIYSRRDDAPARELAEMLDGSGAALDLGEFKAQFFDTLLELADAKTLLAAAPRGFEWRDRLRERAIAPILREIRFEIRVAADVLKSNPEVALRAGEKLDANTAVPMKALREFFSGKREAPFSDVSDELAMQLSVCAHRAFRNAERDDAVLRKALKLQKRAQSVAAGTRTKNVCADNGAAIWAEAERLAPAGTRMRDREINDAIYIVSLHPTIKSAETLMAVAKPLLFEIKSKIGGSHRYYRRILREVLTWALHGIRTEADSAKYANDTRGWNIEHKLRVLRSAQSALRELRTFEMSEYFSLEVLSKFEVRVKHNRELLESALRKIRAGATSGVPAGTGENDSWGVKLSIFAACVAGVALVVLQFAVVRALISIFS